MAECREENKRLERRWGAKVRLRSKGWKAVKELEGWWKGRSGR